jgi:hypothetical protein
MTITASGRVLEPLLVFKGKPGGRIEKRDFPNYPRGIVYACQEKAWMDERVILMWLESVLQPYVSKAPEHIVPILFLDSYRCHMMSSVVNKIHELGVIPGGCTDHCQPVDIGVNKPFKDRIREQWVSWILEDITANGSTHPISRRNFNARSNRGTTSTNREECMEKFRLFLV